MTAKKYDSGKAPVWQGLLAYFPRACNEVAAISKYGSEKYQVPYHEKNWLGIDGLRYLDAASRHIALHSIDPIDSESGHYHLGHAAWSLLAALEKILMEDTPLRQSESQPPRRVDSVPATKTVVDDSNGGLVCDMLQGPCACGAWHTMPDVIEVGMVPAGQIITKEAVQDLFDAFSRFKPKAPVSIPDFDNDCGCPLCVAAGTEQEPMVRHTHFKEGDGRGGALYTHALYTHTHVLDEHIGSPIILECVDQNKHFGDLDYLGEEV